MDNDPENLLKQEEKTVFLSDGAREDRKKPMPWLMVIVMVLTIVILFWKTSVRQPENREKALQGVIERNKAEEERIDKSVRKMREEYIRKHPEEVEKYGISPQKR
ncbi:MAG: hypothetical protein KDI90_03805 [Alphaproteobacteria bacterium]|nr:hypothetical protein [Alphaproteobacteria bacterium]MCB9974182.1 hypothetical protein [Rhodospirillales bacterium]